ncbi:kinesin-like protein KIF19 isoform X2 [Ornithodoros turicata]|uniref:kinesin-like protein KIF19 isoform X2 n=1 Tax=Ornithodoros turicata TaxID=34597 RepID=UPI003139FE9E
MSIRKTAGSEDGDESKTQRLLVALRIRPILPNEVAKGATCVAHKIDDKTVLLVDPQSTENAEKSRGSSKKVASHRYSFEWVFDERSTQEELYEKVGKPLVENVLQGYNGTVFAYGATGAGKTYTMVGNDKNPGMMVRVFDDLFQFAKYNQGETHTSIVISYMEIYNENIRDLLNASNTCLELREDPTGGNQVVGLSEIEVTNSAEVLRLLQKGNKRRTVEPTAANQTSSRSHALLRVSIRQSSRDPSDVDVTQHRVGKLFMVDLAGSERASQTQNTGKRLKEGAHINKSLLALGNVINALAVRNPKYVNFRDSKLTRLLKEALSGNCKTVMIAHVGPDTTHYDESRNTLVFADRAKNITNKVRSNMVDVTHHVKQYQSIITELRQEIQKLQDKIEENEAISAMRDAETSPDIIDNGTSDEDHVTDTNANEDEDENVEQVVEETEKVDADKEMRELRGALIESFNKQMEVRRKMMEIDNCLLALSTDLEKLSIIINQWETEKVKFEDGDSQAEEEPEHVRQAWEDIEFIQGEQQKFLTLREDVEKEFEEARERTYKLTESLPNVVSSEDQRELLRLLTQVHKLEVEKIEMQTDQLIREHELRQRDLMIVRYDRQRLLCDEIIGKQKLLINELSSGMRRRKARNSQAARELNELYRIYQQEIQDLASGRDSVMKHLNVNPYRPNSVLGLRPLGSSESMWDLTHMEPLREEDDKMDQQGVPLSSQSDNGTSHHVSRTNGDLASRTVPSLHPSNHVNSHSLSEPTTPGSRLTSRLPPVEVTNYVSRRDDIEASTRKISSLAAQRRSLRTAEHGPDRWESVSDTPQVRRYVGGGLSSVDSRGRLRSRDSRRDSVELLPHLEDTYTRTNRKKEQDSCSIQ